MKTRTETVAIASVYSASSYDEQAEVYRGKRTALILWRDGVYRAKLAPKIEFNPYQSRAGEQGEEGFRALIRAQESGKRIRHVWRSPQHIWANPDTGIHHARNPQDNYSFRTEGDKRVLTSYQTDIAVLFPKRKIAFISDRSYSNTTTRHQSLARNALHDCEVFYVNVIPRDLSFKSLAKAAYEYQFQRAQKAGKTATRCQIQNIRIYLECVAKELRNVRRRFRFLPQKAKAVDRETAIIIGRRIVNDRQWPKSGALGAEWRAVLNKRAERNRREREEQRKKEEARLAQEKLRIEEWRSGASRELWLPYRSDALLRLSGDAVETSKGITMPIQHFRALLRQWRKGQLAVGQRILEGYMIRQLPIEDDPRLIIGCHAINLSEILAIESELERRVSNDSITV